MTEDNKTELINGVINPLHTTPYEEQLAAKEAYCRNALRKITQELYRAGTPMRVNVSRLPCHVGKIVRSQVLTQYRNKEEFSIWRGIDGKSPTVGYMMFPLGKHGDTVCVEPEGIEILKPEASIAAKILQEFIRNSSKYPVCYDLGHQAGWRRFAVRNNSDGDIMIVGYMSPIGLTVRNVLDERENFKNFIIKRSQEVGLKLKSLYFQPCPKSRCSHRDVPYELLYGESRLHENYGNLKIAVSPESYLPPNSVGAEVLYQTAKNAAITCFEYKENSVRPLVINPACGAGLLSMNFAGLASHVVGVDFSEQSIADARYNAKMNAVENIEFICSEFEMVVEKLLQKHSGLKREMLIVAHTNKRGLNRHVIQSLKKCREVKKMVLILPSLETSQITQNLIDLCMKSSDKTRSQFMPLVAIPVDTSPHVESCETILVLERLQTE